MSKRYAIGLDLGGTRVKGALVESNGGLKGQAMEPSRTGEGYEPLLDHLAGIATALKGDIPTAGEPVGMGLGVAGLVDAERRRVRTSPNIPFLNGRDVAADLEHRTGLPVILDNDANMMAMGEGAGGAARGCRHYIAITLGTGVGGAVVSGGVLVRGFQGGGGEIGHIPISRRGRHCSCGGTGCLEAYIGRRGVDRYISRKLPQYRGLGLKALNRMATDGDRAAATVFAYIGKTLAVAMGGLVNVFNPEVLVIGGGVAAAGELLFKPFREELRRRAFAAYLECLSVKPAELGDWAGVVGAGYAAFSQSAGR